MVPIEERERTLVTVVKLLEVLQAAFLGLARHHHALELLEDLLSQEWDANETRSDKRRQQVVRLLRRCAS
jgi:uncharacterized protein YerC